LCLFHIDGVDVDTTADVVGVGAGGEAGAGAVGGATGPVAPGKAVAGTDVDVTDGINEVAADADC